MMGIVSFGKIGQSIALRAKAFGVEIVVFDPYQDERVITARGARKVSKEELLRTANVIMMQVPMTPETKHFLSDAEFGIMQNGTIIVNTGRGPTIDNRALHQALLSGRIAGAGLDDPEEEPAKRKTWSPADNPLFSHPNVIVTPHSAYYSEQSIRLARETAAHEVRRVLTGEQPLNPVNRLESYGHDSRKLLLN
jgi:D-3-phosphoglycerate dehydrogenase / 2-oxoglutarate reductase